MASGDRAGLAQLYDRYASLLCGVGIRMLGERRDAEDVTHDVFLEAWHKAAAYDVARGSVRSWLLLRMRSRCLDRKKSVAERRVHVTSDFEPVESRQRRDVVGPDLCGTDADRLRNVLAGLPPEQKEAIELCYFNGLSGSEASSQLGVPLGTVKSRVAAAMGKLRAALRVDGP